MLGQVEFFEAQFGIRVFEELLELLFAFEVAIAVLLISFLPDNFASYRNNHPFLELLNLYLERFGEDVVLINYGRFYLLSDVVYFIIVLSVYLT